jgi:adenylate cyclase
MSAYTREGRPRRDWQRSCSIRRERPTYRGGGLKFIRFFVTFSTAWRRAGLFRLRMAVILLAAALALGLQGISPGWMQTAEHLAYDLRWRMGQQDGGENRIVIVDIDEQSLAQVGDWPWSRRQMARLIEQLVDRYQVQLVALDMVFPEPREGDEALAAQLAREEVIGSQVFDFTPGSGNHSGALVNPIPLGREDSLAKSPHAAGYLANHAALKPANAGHISPILDSDGKVRRLYPVICHQRQCYATLAAAIYQKLLGSTGWSLGTGSGSSDAHWRLAPLPANDPNDAIPLAADHSVLIPFARARESWRAVPAYEILQGKADPEVLRGVIAIVGGTALGLTDVIATPTASAASGVELHAQLLAGLLDQELSYSPRGAVLYNMALMALLGILLSGMLAAWRRSGPRNWALPAWMASAVILAAGANFLLWQQARLALPLMPVLLFILSVVLLLAPLEIYHAWRQRQGIYRQLSAYVPEQVASELADRGEVSGNVEAEHRTVTILFADIHGFAAMAEGREPEVIAAFLQRVFGELVDIVIAHRGTVDKFIGDAMMAMWNAPQDDPEHARHAIEAALAIQAAAEKSYPLSVQLGLPPLRIGIGIQTGDALVGNFGSTHRRTYTALGEPAIVASRLEELTRELNQPILVGSATAQSVGEGCCTSLGKFAIRGLVAPLEIFVPKDVGCGDE